MGRKENKRKKYFHTSANKKARFGRALDAGMRGFLITCGNLKEKDCVREAYGILNLYADKLYGPEKVASEASDSEGGDDDPDAAIEREVAAIKNTSKQVRRFQSVDSGGKNVVFIKTTLENPTSVTDAMFADMVENKLIACKSICRLMPVVGTCKAHMENMSKTSEQVLAPFFKDIPHSYSILIKIRNNNSLSRNDILPQMGDIIKSLNSENSVDLHSPDYVISLDVITNICCISVMKEFNEYRKYNLQELACKINKEKSQEGKKEPVETTETNKCEQLTETQESINQEQSHDITKTEVPEDINSNTSNVGDEVTAKQSKDSETNSETNEGNKVDVENVN